jgi:hypothetical protein
MASVRADGAGMTWRLTIQEGREASIESDGGEICAFREFEFHPLRDAFGDGRRDYAREAQGVEVRGDGSDLEAVVARIGSDANESHQPRKVYRLGIVRREAGQFASARRDFGFAVGDEQSPAIADRKLHEC